MTETLQAGSVLCTSEWQVNLVNECVVIVIYMDAALLVKRRGKFAATSTTKSSQI